MAVLRNRRNRTNCPILRKDPALDIKKKLAIRSPTVIYDLAQEMKPNTV
jgi:hypothetical protein